MKRSRDEDENDLQLKLEQINTLVSIVQKKIIRNKNNTDRIEIKSVISPPQDDSFMKEKILAAVGHIAQDAPIEVVHIDQDVPMPSGVKSYSLIVEYPNVITSTERANIMNIPGIVQGAMESAGVGKMKLTMVYCTDKQVALKMHSGAIGQRNPELTLTTAPQDTDGKILHEVESFIPFVRKYEPRVIQNPYIDGVSQTVFMQKVQSPVKFSQVEKIGSKEVIQDIQFTPSQDTDHLRVVVQYLKQV